MNETKSMLPNKPFIIRAYYDWITKSDCTPYIVVDTSIDFVEVPEEYIDNNQIVLNIAPEAIDHLELQDRFVAFSAQFSGELQHIYIPVMAISAIYAKENGRGMMFDHFDEDDGHPMLEPIARSAAFQELNGSDPSGSSKSGGSPAGASHLKIIK